MSKNNKHFLLLAFCSFLVTGVFGQAAPTPFSTFGIGERYGNALIHNQGMGGVGIGTPQYWYLNNQNPALLVYNSLTLFEAGIVGEFKTISGDTLNERSTGGNMNYLAMAFPIRPRDVTKRLRWTTSVGLMPYTNVNYNLQYTDDVDGNTNTVIEEEKGSGGLTQLYWSNGYRISKNVSLGLKATYIFSSILNEYSNAVAGTGQTIPYKIYVSERTYVKDFSFTPGVAFNFDSIMGGKSNLHIGAIYSFATDLNATKKSKLNRTNLTDNLIDSLTLSSASGSLHLPAEFGFGASLIRRNWVIGMDFTYQDWADFESIDPEDEQNLEASWRVAIGSEFTPDPYAYESLFKKSTYRLGLSMEKMPFLPNNQQVRDFGINFGISVPTGRSSLDLAFKVGKRGNRTENILEETYFKVYFGLTLNDQWFIRRKFD